MLLGKIIYLCLAAAAFFLPLLPGAAVRALAAAGIFAAADSVAAGRLKLAVPRQFWLLVLFFALAAASLPNSPRYAESLYNFEALATQYFFIYWLAISYVRTRRELYGLFLALGAAAFLTASYGIYQYFGGGAAAAEWVDAAYFPDIRARAFSTLANPNILASFLVTAMALCIGWVFADARLPARAGAALVLLTSFACLVLTFSRGAWLSAAAMLIAAAAFERRLLYIVLPAALAPLVFLPNAVAERFVSAFQGADTSSLLRFALWESTAAMVRDHPFTGIGWGAYRFVYPKYDFYIKNHDTIIYHAHNMYLHIAAEIGLLGLAVFLLLLFWHFYLALRVWKTAASAGEKACALGLCAMFFATLLGGFADHTLFNREISSLFWLLSAASFALWRQAGQSGVLIEQRRWGR
ncbi:MAG: O-antigen ligase family protein [Acidaminococcales bacterium]|jgi:putative inorganic carbon (HCO3(-)) transporter|nr:O-antigen ligase family protein [Acidaminococcales bacterium]